MEQVMSEELNKFRAQIDAIDDKIIDLLKQRLEIVKKVGAYKARTSATGSFIRAGREALMLRDLTAKIEGKFPAAAIATIWRMIISTSLCYEQKMSIAAYVSDNDQSCFWHAREYYGTFVPISTHKSTDEVIKDVVNSPSAIGILPLLDNSGSPWWIRPGNEKNNVYIFARIPFIEENNLFAKPVIAIANVMPEPTDDDISVIAVHTKSPLDEIQNAFAAHKLNANIITTKNGTDYLIEIDKFLAIGDKKLATINHALAEGSFIRLMGAYAAPMLK
jgi:chorismate mutase/prephenate dehydratase